MSHIYCPECGFQNPEAANYCSKCGALLVHVFAEGEEPELSQELAAELRELVEGVLEQEGAGAERRLESQV